MSTFFLQVGMRRAQHERRLDYTLMAAKYSTQPLLKRWSVMVYPVPKELRSETRSALIPSGTGKIRRWFIQPRMQLWLAEPHALRLRFVVATRTLENDDIYD
jgi:hypothetical protein